MIIHRRIGGDGRIRTARQKVQFKGSADANDNFILPVADGTVKISGGDQRLRTSTIIRNRPEREEEQEVLRGESDELSSPTHSLEMISGLLQEISSVAITWNAESNCTCREKNRFLFR